MAPDTTKLATILADLLASAVASLTSPPARQYVSAGPPAADCEQLTVHCVSLRTVTLPQPNDRPAPATQPRGRVAVCAVTLWHEVCAAEHPKPADLDADGAAHATAGYELYAGLLWMASTGTLLPSFPAPSSQTRATAVSAADVQAAAGGLAGWVVSVEVTL